MPLRSRSRLDAFMTGVMPFVITARERIGQHASLPAAQVLVQRYFNSISSSTHSVFRRVVDLDAVLAVDRKLAGPFDGAFVVGQDRVFVGAEGFGFVDREVCVAVG